MKVNVRQLFRRAWSSLPSIRKNGPDIGNTVVSSGGEVEDTKTTFVLNNNPVSPVPSVVLLSIDPVSRKIEEIPFLSPNLPAWEIIPDVRSADTSVSLKDDLTCLVEINLESLPGLRKRIFGFNRPVAFTSKSSKESAVTMYTERALDEIGYADSPFFYQGIDTGFNFDYLKDLQEVSAKRGARIKLFGLEEDINKYPRYLVAFCNKLAKASRELFRHRFGELARQHKIEDIGLLKFLMTRSGLYSQGNNSPYRRAKELAKEIDRIDELVASGQKQFWQMRKNIKAGIKSSTPDRNDEISALFEWLDDPQKREENAKVICALQMLAGKEGALAVPKEEDEPPCGELVEIYADEMPNNFSRILDTVEAECRNCFLEMLDNRFDVLTQAANFSEPTTQEPDGKGDEAPSPSQATCDFVVTEESAGAEQVTGTESANLTGTPKTTEVEMTVSDVLGLAKDSTIDIVREAFRRECVWITTREKQLVDEYNRALAEAQLREELETEAEKGRSVIWKREFLKWGGVIVAAATVVGAPTGYAIYRYNAANRISEEKEARLLGIKQLKSDIEACIKIDFEAICQREADELKNKSEEIKFGYLGYYLQREPSDEELHTELKYFLENHKEILVDPEILPQINNYLENKITKEKLADYLLMVGPIRQKLLPDVLFSLQIVRAIATNKFLRNLPGDLKGIAINDLRDIFELKEWNLCGHLEARKIQGQQILSGQIVPTVGQLIGTFNLIGGGKPFLIDFISGKKRDNENAIPPLFRQDSPYVSRASGNIELLRQKVYERAVEVKNKYENPERNPEIAKLLYWANQLDNVDSLETLEPVRVEIGSVVSSLTQSRMRLEPVLRGLARCFVISSEYEALIKQQDKELKEQYRAKKNQ